jgi:bifunctional DNA-binding transcriptional regulator/antitoxin component of YhaV-PrlF toxin-antitoxin module
MNERLLRIQVKTSTQETQTPDGHPRCVVALATCGGNQSWTGITKRIDPSRFDYLFALTARGRRWLIPSVELEGRNAISLGGPKYAEYEIEPGPRIRDIVYDEPSGLKSSSPGEYPSGQRTAAVNRQALPSEVRILPPPSSSSEHPGPAEGLLAPAVGRTRLSSNHQLTIPLAPFEAAGLEVGDRFRVEAESKGRVVITRIEEYMERHLEQLALPRSSNGSDGNE